MLHDRIRNRYLVMLFRWLLLVFLLKFSTDAFGDENQNGLNSFIKCPTMTSDGKKVVCVKMQDCPPLLNVIEKKGINESEKTNLLKKLRCGRPEDNMYFCQTQNLRYDANSSDFGPKPCVTSDDQTGTLSNAQNFLPPSTLRRNSEVKSSGVVFRDRAQRKTLPPTTENVYARCGKSEKKNSLYTTSQNVVMPGDWPWMVALGFAMPSNHRKYFKCDGSLISNQWFVTSAICVGTMGQNPTLLIARLGDLDLHDNGEDKAKPIDIAVRKIVVHPHFFINQPNSIAINSDFSNDIALVQLAEPVNFTKSIRPICILSEPHHKTDEFYSNKIPFLVGWSAAVPVPNYKPSKRYSFTLKESQTDIIDNEDCAELYKNVGPLSTFDERVLCAKNEKDVTCQGDTGGALIMMVEDKYYLAGIASYGVQCRDSVLPAVFTRIAYFADWIENTTGCLGDNMYACRTQNPAPDVNSSDFVHKTCVTSDGQTGTLTNARNCSLHPTSPRNPASISGAVVFSDKPREICCPLSATLPKTTENVYASCGISDTKHDITVSPQRNLKLGDWPWMAALGYRTATNPTPRFMCGASLISNQWLLTQARCANTRRFILTIARFGDLHLNNDGDNSTIVEIPIDGVILHPNYTTDSKKISDDIALIRLKNPVNFTNFIRPVCILGEPDHKTNEFYSEKWFYEVSWNRSKPSESSTKFKTLQQISLKIEENENCAQKYQNQPLSLINEQVLCAGADNSNESCQLISGGSLNIQIESRYYLAGVSSYGICKKSGYPTVFTRMAYYAEWIKRVANF